MSDKIDKSKRNRNAGKSPSYAKRGMSKEAISNKRAYDKKYSATKERKKYRAELNKANRQFTKEGKNKVGDRSDASHLKNGKIVLEDKSKNRARNGAKQGESKRSARKSTKK